MRRFLFLPVVALGLALGSARAEEADYFPAVAKLIEDRCIDCHAADDPEGKFVMETHADLLKGGESGAALVPGKSAESLLVKYLRGEVEVNGKRKFMPPGKREKLTAEEIDAFRKWIDDGAKPPQRAMVAKKVEVPHVAPKVAPRMAVTSMSFSETRGLLAVGRYGLVELIDPRTQMVVKRLEGHAGNVNDIAWSKDGAQLFAASGESAVAGEVKQWDVENGTLIRTWRGHRDTIYALALSPDGRLLATGSYDQKIKLWNVSEGKEERTLTGHNGAVFGLAFRPDGRFLASASADRTVKIWEVATGERRDTLTQPLKEQVAVAWSPDGKRLGAAGGDHRIRVWAISPEARETSNPLLHARFAHEQPILRLAWGKGGILSSAQDGIVKLWEPEEVKERVAIGRQADWSTAVAFAGELIVAGRADGALAFFDATTGKPVRADKPGASRTRGCEPAVAEGRSVVMMRGIVHCEGESLPVEGIECQAGAKPAPEQAKPGLTGLFPRAVQRGSEVEVSLRGKNLAKVLAVRCADQRVAVFTGPPTDTAIPLIVRIPAEVARGSYDLQVLGPDGKEVGRTALQVTSIPVREFPPDHVGEAITAPATVFGGLSKAGESDRFEFSAKKGQTIILDGTSKGIGGKADLVLQLADRDGAVLASSNNFNGEDAPFIAYRIPADGEYAAVVKDLQMAGGPEHAYSLTIGELPYVLSVFPTSVPANAESKVELVGFNLPPERGAREVAVKAGGPGEMVIPVDTQRFFNRVRAKLVVTDLPAPAERGGNHEPARAQEVPVPVSLNGRLRTASQPDYFKFTARKGVVYAIETEAARRGSPADTRVAVLHPDGRPVEHLLLEAVRDSAINFRAIDSATPDVRVENWREMELNELMFTGGEVNKIFRMPEGPDSGFQYYTNGGKRIAYFNTTATAHSLDEPCYIVEPHPPGTPLAPNGLPRFVLHYENDDDGERELGTDSRVLFRAPSDGEFLVRVDESRGFGGETFNYRLIIREAREDFAASVAEFDGTVNAGSGAPFTIAVDRKDGFDGDIHCEIRGVPEGWHVTTPLLVQSGHLRARGSIFALPGAKQPTADEWKAVKITARANLAGAEVNREIGTLPLPKLQGAPQVHVGLVPPAPGKHEPASEWREFDPGKPFELVIAPGEIIPAWLVIKRAGANGALRFDVENLPHGVIVDNLGLNGITLLEGQQTGEIFFKAAAWVKEQDRLAYAVCRDAGNQAALPFMLRVRQKAEKSTIVNVK